MKDKIKKILSDFLYDMHIHNPPNFPPQEDLIEYDFKKTTERILNLIAPSQELNAATEGQVEICSKNICEYCFLYGQCSCEDYCKSMKYISFVGRKLSPVQ